MALTKHNRLTVADLRAVKGKRQLTMLFVETPEEAAAASAAGIDILSIVEHLWSASMREAAGDCFVQVGLIYGQHCTYEDYLRAAHKNLMIGGDAFYCAGSLDTIAKLAAEGIPVVGHVGLIPARATWTGGFKAVGKTAAEATQVYSHVKAARGRRRGRGRNRGRAGARGERDCEAHDALSHVDGRGLRLRRAISVRRGRARLFARPSAASRQGLSRLSAPSTIAATRAHRRLPGVPRRCRKGRVSRRTSISCRSRTASSTRS